LQRAVGVLDIHAFEEQHVQADVEVQRTAKVLDQGDRAGLVPSFGENQPY
jgi:hypothetical protein